MANISQTFTYAIADDYLAQTTALNKTATWTYNGPDKIVTFVDTESGRWLTHIYTEDQAADIPTPLNATRVEIDCVANPLLACLLGADTTGHNLASHSVEDLPDGTVYARLDPTPPLHTYDVTQLEFNSATGTFNMPPPFLKPYTSWHELRFWRNSLLDDSDHVLLPDTPAQVVEKWTAYRNKLFNLPQVHGAASSIKTTINLSATSPINTAGQVVIEVADITGVTVGMHLGMQDRKARNIFGPRTEVVSINNKQVTLTVPLMFTPTADNNAISFLSVPTTHPWKIQSYDVPDANFRESTLEFNLTVDTSASSPVNTAGQTILQVTDVSTITQLGLQIVESTNTVFSNDTRVLNMDATTKQLTLSKPILVTPVGAITVTMKHIHQSY